MKRTVTAMEARKRFGELLDGVHYRGDEVVIERAGKVMGVLVPEQRYAAIERSRQEFFDTIKRVQATSTLQDLADDEVMDLVNKEIKAYRREKRERERQQQLPDSA